LRVDVWPQLSQSVQELRGFPTAEVVEFTCEAEVFAPEISSLLQPICIDQSKRIVLGVLLDRAKETFVVAHVINRHTSTQSAAGVICYTALSPRFMTITTAPDSMVDTHFATNYLPTTPPFCMSCLIIWPDRAFSAALSS
jgi:hypothetical protein